MSTARLRHLEEHARRLGRDIWRGMPNNAGFVLVVFDYGPGGWMTYLSSGQRADCIKMLRELLGRLEKEQS